MNRKYRYLTGVSDIMYRYKWIVMVPTIIVITATTFTAASTIVTRSLMWLVWQVCGLDGVESTTMFYLGGALGAIVNLQAIIVASWVYDRALSLLLKLRMKSLMEGN